MRGCSTLDSVISKVSGNVTDLHKSVFLDLEPRKVLIIDEEKFKINFAEFDVFDPEPYEFTSLKKMRADKSSRLAPSNLEPLEYESNIFKKHDLSGSYILKQF